MAAILEDGRLRLSGYVGDYYYEDGFSSDDVVLALAQISDEEELVVHINSPGGIASEGAAIHALLKARNGTTDVVVEGIAMSAASLIAMAGDTVIMSAGAVMMIHDPSGMTWGTSEDHSKTIEGLEALATAYARVYAAKSGKTAEECREIMKAERWFTPDQAVAEGFADETTELKAEPVAAFDYRILENAPQRLKALASKKNWSLPTSKAAAAAPSPPNGGSMTDKERADQLAAENAKLKSDLEAATASGDTAVKADRDRRAAIMALEETAGREPLAEHLYLTGKSVDEAKATLAVSPKSTQSDSQTDAATLEASRLNGAGLSGKPAAGSGKSAPTLLVDTMRKQIGKGAA
ncbi:MAG TPA: head maturation protease, ClpP-related [Devosia sp.]|jgi:ATP-dependent Clp protease protease subunit|nr:head maturation protease, ClpP-related [Devosia sp.]